MTELFTLLFANIYRALLSFCVRLSLSSPASASQNPAPESAQHKNHTFTPDLKISSLEKWQSRANSAASRESSWQMCLSKLTCVNNGKIISPDLRNKNPMCLVAITQVTQLPHNNDESFSSLTGDWNHFLNTIIPTSMHHRASAILIARADYRRSTENIFFKRKLCNWSDSGKDFTLTSQQTLFNV